MTCLPERVRAQKPWRFIVTCDSRGQTNGIQVTILSELVKEITSRDVDFVLFPGDLVSGYVTDGPGEFEAQLRAWVQIVKPVYDAGIGVYVCRGNHDIMDVWGRNPRPDVDPDDNFATRWLNVFGNELFPQQKLPDNGPAGEKYMTYSVAHKNALVVSLDGYAGIKHDTVNRVNQKWLEAQLSTNTKPHVFITTHEPAFKALHADCLDNWPAERDMLWTSIRNAGGRVFLCGHDHFYDHARVIDEDGDPGNDIHQYIVGTAGATLYSWSPPYNGNNSSYTIEQQHHAQGYGYVLVEVNDLDATLTWMERNTMDLNIPGSYKPRESWSYVVTPKLLVVRPNGGEKLTTAGTYAVTWKTIGGAQVDSVIIEYSIDAGQNWLQMSRQPNTGSYLWNPVPLIDSNECLIRISDAGDSTLSDVSDGTFTIFQCLKTLAGDLNGDCYVDILDFAILAGDWLQCGNPFDAACE